jgi:hypothetical protein
MREALILFLVIGSLCEAADSNQPVTFRCVNPGELHVSTRVMFWATNHTTNTFAVSLNAIENKAGTNWVVQWQGWQALLFKPPGGGPGPFFLGPHAAGYATVQPFYCSPTGTTWRAKAMLQPPLTGSSATAAHLRYFPDLLQRRIRGDTNISLNPCSTNMTFFGTSIYVLSQEVSEQ